MKSMKIRRIYLPAIGILMVLAITLQSCSAQRHHHKAVPCPCEKKRR